MRSFKLYVILILLVFLSACSNNGDIIIKEKSVDVEEAVLDSKEIYFVAHGTVLSKNTKKYSFQTGGVLENIPVKVGDLVEKGDLLASLDKQKFNIAVDASDAKQSQAYNDYAKAKQSYDFYSKELSDVKALYESGATSKSNYDQVKLRADIAAKELSQAASQYDASKLQGDLNKSNKADTSIFSDIKGEVLKTIGLKGEVVGAGYPVVVVGSEDREIIAGISRDDKNNIEVGAKATISFDKHQLNGEVKSISGMPDSETLSYEIKVEFDKLSSYTSIGQIVSPHILIGKKEGIWLSITNVLNDGRDYLYIASPENSSTKELVYRAEKRYIDVLYMHEDSVMVDGVKPSELIITSGTSSLTDGYKVLLNNK